MSETSLAPASTTARPASRRRPLFGRVLLIVSLLLGLWVGWLEAPREIARWYLAAAMEHRDEAEFHRRYNRQAEADRNSAAAEAALRRALAWDPNSAEAHVVRAGWHSRKNEPEQALADYARALQVGGDSISIRKHRSELYVQMKRYREAIEDQLAIYEQLRSNWWLRDSASNYLNGAAYLRAVANQDLHQALKEINQVLAGSDKTPLEKLSANERMEQMMWLDTRGYILYRLGRHKEAINDMDRAATLARARFAELSNPVERKRRLYASPKLRDMREFQAGEASLFYNLGVIFYHRSLVLEKLKHKRDAAADRKLATQLLGVEPDESVF